MTLSSQRGLLAATTLLVLHLPGCAPLPESPPLGRVPAAEDLTDLPPRAQRLVEERRASLAEEPERAELWLDLAMIFHANSEHDLAVTAYENVIALDPGEGRAQYLCSHVLWQQGKTAMANEQLESWLESGIDYAPAFRTRATWALAAGSLETALSAADKALELAPGDVGARAVKGRVELASGRYQEALATLSAASRTGEGRAYLRFLAARARQGATGTGPAVAPEPEPRWSDPWLEAISALGGGVERDLEEAQAALAAGNTETAVRLLKPVLAWHPDHPRAVQVLALAHRQSGDHAAALQLLEDAVARQPRIAEHHVQLAATHYLAAVASGESGDFESALTAARRLQELLPTDFRGHAIAGDVLSGTGDYEAALTEYETCGALAPRSRARCEVKAARCLLRLGRGPAAALLLRDAFGSEPADREAAALLDEASRLPRSHSE